MCLKFFSQKGRTKLFASTTVSTSLKWVNAIKLWIKFSMKGVNMDTIIYTTYFLRRLFLREKRYIELFEQVYRRFWYV